MAKKLGTRTIVVSRQAEADRLDPEPPPPVEHQVTGCIVWPQSAYEEERGWVGVDAWSVAAPYAADIKSDDQIRLLGIPDVSEDVLWDITGTPSPYEKKNGRPKAKVVNLSRAS